MRILLVIMLAAVACGQPSSVPPKPTPEPPDRWTRVEAAAQELVAPGPIEPLASALAQMDDRDLVREPPDAAIDALYAWASAKGGLPWRGDHSLASHTAAAKAAKLAITALARRAADAQTPRTVLYLAHRLRGEGSCPAHVWIGFDLAATIRATPGATANTAEPAPTEAEVRRSLALEAVCDRWQLEHTWNELVSNRDAARRGVIGGERLQAAAAENHSDDELRAGTLAALEALALDAPPDRHQLVAHAHAIIASHEHSWPLLMLIGDVVPLNLETMVKTLDGFEKPADAH